MRGKAGLFPACDSGKGITPACAGKSMMSCTTLTVTGDHPRVCGEKGFVLYFKLFPQGSPPRVRGKGALARDKDGKPGITPACAGKSHTRSGD